jgi:hypothetical protein
MSGGYLSPMLITVGASFGNHLYNTGQWDFKILVTGAIATGLLGLLNAGMPQVATGIAWLAFTGQMLVPYDGNSPVENLLKIVNTNK